jgi:hypothetical protein
MEPHERPVDGFLQGIDGQQAQRGSHPHLEIAGRTLAGEEPGQALERQLAEALALGHEPLLERGLVERQDNGDGTVTDNQTGLQWEKKTNSNVSDTYTWSSTGTAPDGTLFTSFLATMNCQISVDGSCGLAGHYDWRIPNIAELKTIVDPGAAGCGSGSPCIDPIFGPTAVSHYWSSSSDAGGPADVWHVFFIDGSTSSGSKTGNRHAGRAGRLVIGPDPRGGCGGILLGGNERQWDVR